MPVHTGKPGSKRITGQLRSQVKQVRARCTAFLALQARLADKTPPITFMSELGVAAVTACRQQMDILIAQRNQ